jgi:CubicO group peptidase (beta-lactamase class C family)
MKFEPVKNNLIADPIRKKTMKGMVEIWIGAKLIFVLASCSKCDNDYLTRTPLSFSQVQEFGVEGCMDYYYIPGCTWAVIKKEDLITGAAGTIFEGSSMEVQVSHHFQIGSLGKSYTSLMAAKCVEEGLLSWDTKLFSVFPEWEQKAHQDYHDLTLSNLLSHRTNLPPLNKHQTHVDNRTGTLVYEDIPNFSGSDPERRRAFCQYALSLDPLETEELNYGNSGYVMAGCMIEKVTGKTWETLALQTAAALDIKIGFERPNRYDPAQPWGHVQFANKGPEPVHPLEMSVYNDPLFSPAGNIHVNILDFSNYIKQFLMGLKNQEGFLKAESFRYLLMSNQPYAMGWYNNFDSDSIFYHYGSEGTFYCHMMIFTNLNSAIIIFTNAPSGDNAVNFINDARNYLKQKYIYGDQP